MSKYKQVECTLIKGIGLLLVTATLAACTMHQESVRTEYRATSETNHHMFEYHVRTIRCTYNGNDTYETEDGNLWVFTDDITRKQGKRYLISISDEGTDCVDDDVVMEVR